MQMSMMTVRTDVWAIIHEDGSVQLIALMPNGHFYEVVASEGKSVMKLGEQVFVSA